jgi:hypothetical protein
MLKDEHQNYSSSTVENLKTVGDLNRKKCLEKKLVETRANPVA